MNWVRILRQSPTVLSHCRFLRRSWSTATRQYKTFLTATATGSIVTIHTLSNKRASISSVLECLKNQPHTRSHPKSGEETRVRPPSDLNLQSSKKWKRQNLIDRWWCFFPGTPSSRADAAKKTTRCESLIRGIDVEPLNFFQLAWHEVEKNTKNG